MVYFMNGVESLGVRTKIWTFLALIDFDFYNSSLYVARYDDILRFQIMVISPVSYSYK